MSAKIIDGIAIAGSVREQCRQQASILIQEGFMPGLAVIIVGDNAASRVYVRNKVKACTDIGIHSEVHELSADTKSESIIALIKSLNADKRIHGILVQLPLPSHMNQLEILETIAVEKDVDGFHAENIGRLVIGQPLFISCTPFGVMKMLEYHQIPIWGQNVVVVGASNIVGKPMAFLLLQKGATITICNSKTRDLARHTSQADILIVAVGRAQMIKGDMVKEGAVVIDVGMNRLDDGKLVGDVDFEQVRQRASYITPVPGGVGPMTVTMLVYNTVQSAQRLRDERQISLACHS